MLLFRNYILLLHLHLSQITFNVARKILQNGERQGKLQQKIFFLSHCLANGLMPSTISNIHLPQCFNSPSLASSKHFIQRYILNKTRRHLYSQLHECQREWNILYQQLRPFKQDLHILAQARADARGYSEWYFNLDFGRKAFNLSMHPRNCNDSQNHPLSKPLQLNPRRSGPVMGQPPQLVTDMTNTLSADQTNLLTKGPKFSLAPGIECEQVQEDFLRGFCRFAYNFRFRTSPDMDLSTPSPLPKYPQASYISQPPIIRETEAKLNRIFHNCSAIIKNVPPRPPNGNLSFKERRSLQQLRALPNIYLPSDKGGEFCVIDTKTYHEAGKFHLDNMNTYQRVARMSAKTIEGKINTAWKVVCRDNGVPQNIARSLNSTNTRIPPFYHLIKTHKPGPELQIRPIVASFNSPTSKISWLLTQLLNEQLNMISSHTASSDHLIRDIRHLPNDTLSQYHYPFSLDVTALYTSIPINDAIRCTVGRLENQHFQRGGLGSHAVKLLLEAVLTNTYFQYEGTIYKQVSGLPMGSSVSSIIAIIYMDYVETQALHLCGGVAFYRRYVDDCFLLATNRDDALNILHVFNSIDEHIQFTEELPSCTGNDHRLSLSLLDFTITLTTNGDLSFEFFSKPARKPLFIHSASHLPVSIKSAAITNEQNRINDKCTSEAAKKKHTEQFEDTLYRNGYRNTSPAIIAANEGAIRRHHGRVAHPRDDQKVFYLEMPFVSNFVNRKIRQAFAREGVSIRIWNKARTLRNALQPKPASPACTKPWCSMKTTGKCYAQNVVYQLVCPSCNQSYIGSTQRHLHIRVKEHLTRENSSYFAHTRLCPNVVPQVSVLARERNTINLRLREGIIIQQRHPQINNHLDNENFKHFVCF